MHVYKCLIFPNLILSVCFCSRQMRCECFLEREEDEPFWYQVPPSVCVVREQAS